jgi:hypothetical protein
MTESNWTHDEFLCFVMIYASSSDMDFSENEKKTILKTFSEETFAKQLAFFENLNDFQALNAILAYKDQYFSTPDQKQDLLSKIKKQFFSDGFSDFEKEIYNFLDKLF